MQVTDRTQMADFKLYQEHEFFTIFDTQKKISINCLLPTRVLEDILLLAPSILTKMRRQNSIVLNIEDYSVLEKSTFRNAVKFLKTVLSLNYKPFRFNKVIYRTTFLQIYIALLFTDESTDDIF